MLAGFNTIMSGHEKDQFGEVKYSNEKCVSVETQKLSVRKQELLKLSSGNPLNSRQCRIGHKGRLKADENILIVVCRLRQH